MYVPTDEQLTVAAIRLFKIVQFQNFDQSYAHEQENAMRY
jgi:hypothetical protein